MAKTKTKTTKAKSAPEPRIKVAIDAFHDAFVKRHGFRPQIHGGKDGAHMKSMIATWGLDDVLALIETFFTTTDPRVLRCDYTIGALFNLAHHVKLIDARPTDHKTASNVDAATRAMARRL